MEKFTVHTGIAMPLRRSDVDTDQIIPAEYLKRVTRTGFEDGLFSAWREDPSFVLNDPAYAGASILVAGPGSAPGRRGSTPCGRCRTTASGPSSLRRSATSSVTTPSRVACCRWSCWRRRSRSCGSWWRSSPGVELTVDLVAACRSGGRTLSLGVPAGRAQPLAPMEGLDDIGLTLRHEAAIAEYEAARPSFMPVVAGTGPGTALRPWRRSVHSATGGTDRSESLATQRFLPRRCLCPGCGRHTVRAEWLALKRDVSRWSTVSGGKLVNKAELIEALSGRLGDRKSATAALDAVLAEIQTRSPRATRCRSPGSASSRSASVPPEPRATRAPASR